MTNQFEEQKQVTHVSSTLVGSTVRSFESLSSLNHSNDDNSNVSEASIPHTYTQHRSHINTERMHEDEEDEHYYEDDEDEIQDGEDGESKLEKGSKIDIIRTKSNRLDEPDIESAPYSRYGTKEKYFLVFQCALTGFFSIIAGNVYFPVLGVIENKFNITEEQVNITVVMYFVFQGLSPTIVGSLADSLGRRPMVLISIAIYCASCVGLACSQNYAQLVALRCLQAAGISPVIAINTGIMGDITTRAERGAYVGYVTGIQVLGTALGALIGAGISARWNWRAIFWFLTIGSGAVGVFSIFTLPETKRTLVGNGSVPVENLMNKSPITSIPYVRRKLHLNDPEYETLEPKVKVGFWEPFKILRSFHMLVLLFVMGLQFTMFMIHQTALSTALSKKYHYSVMDIGLCYLPAGICTLVSIIASGRFLNWYYAREMAKYKTWLKDEEEKLLQEHHNKEEVKYVLENEPYYAFNVARVRLFPALFTLWLSAAGYIAFGWCLAVKAPLPAVLVTSGFGSLFSNCILTMATTLIVDLFPSKAASSTGCMNLIRCSIAAIFIACLSKMTTSMTYGGVFTFMGGLTTSSSSLLYWMIHNGKQLSLQRKKEEEKLIRDFQNELKVKKSQPL